MPRIKGRFAPLTEELGSDERFLIGCTDLQKLLYILIIYTCHMTRHQAPIDPRYYQRRFMLRARKHQISAGIEAICKQFPKLRCSNGKLSLLNSATYGIEICTEKGLESKKEVKREVKRDKEATPQSLEHAKSFFKSLGFESYAEEFFDFYASKGWVVGRAPMKDWRCAARRWVRNQKNYSQGKAPQKVSELDAILEKKRKENENAKLYA